MFLVLWVALNAYFGLSAVKIGGEEGGIAWEAHIGGFLCGLLIFGVFDAGRAGRGRAADSLRGLEFPLQLSRLLRVFPVRDRMSQSRD